MKHITMKTSSLRPTRLKHKRVEVKEYRLHVPLADVHVKWTVKSPFKRPCLLIKLQTGFPLIVRTDQLLKPELLLWTLYIFHWSWNLHLINTRLGRTLPSVPPPFLSRFIFSMFFDKSTCMLNNTSIRWRMQITLVWKEAKCEGWMLSAG